MVCVYVYRIYVYILYNNLLKKIIVIVSTTIITIGCSFYWPKKQLTRWSCQPDRHAVALLPTLVRHTEGLQPQQSVRDMSGLSGWYLVPFLVRKHLTCEVRMSLNHKLGLQDSDKQKPCPKKQAWIGAKVLKSPGLIPKNASPTLQQYDFLPTQKHMAFCSKPSSKTRSSLCWFLFWILRMVDKLIMTFPTFRWIFGYHSPWTYPAVAHWCCTSHFCLLDASKSCQVSGDIVTSYIRMATNCLVLRALP